MNLIDCHVTEILSKPYLKFGCWWVDVEYVSEGQPGKSNLMFKTEAAAKAVAVGHVFQA
ncbi:hypothetical protein [Pseudomonas sp. SLFW]|uniref:hypothetical protein n=1 Tax=Pseudomonas sp. SLFW TaxID=2683259 RepID=UPI0014128237|nr:hypothetical protein [Pseudomonas sp. SLFW]